MQTTKDIQDYWSESDFEDTVASALIACYETKVKRNRGAAPADRLTDERIATIRAEGPYIASNSRLVLGPAEDGGDWSFDVVNDQLPVKGLHAFRPEGEYARTNKGSYMGLHYVRQVSALGKYWHRRSNGTLYEMLSMDAVADGISGERRFFTVSKTGKVTACTQRIPSSLRGTPGQVTTFIEPEAEWLESTGIYAALALQLLADRRFCWSITAKEQEASAHLGCMVEEIKSLLYARSLPMTSTGRKRPILHLVESHKRRMRNGTDIDITSFLRGIQTVEIAGTVFTVKPPESLRYTVSTPSQERFFDQRQGG